MNQFARFMYGRYGTDQLGFALIILYVLINFGARALRWPILSLLALCLLVFAFYRVFSRNINKRYQENVRFLNVWNRLKRSWAAMQSRAKNSRTYKYFKCPHCKNRLRVPRGRGKIEVTCPVCRTQFRKHS